MVFRNHANGRIPCPACGRMVLAVGHPVKRYRVHHTPHPKYAYRPSGKECSWGGLEVQQYRGQHVYDLTPGKILEIDREAGTITVEW